VSISEFKNEERLCSSVSKVFFVCGEIDVYLLVPVERCFKVTILKTKKEEANKLASSYVVPKGGLEPPCPFEHNALNVACLPISPLWLDPFVMGI
jgi:hypothetical protein